MKPYQDDDEILQVDLIMDIDEISEAKTAEYVLYFREYRGVKDNKFYKAFAREKLTNKLDLGIMITLIYFCWSFGILFFSTLTLNRFGVFGFNIDNILYTIAVYFFFISFQQVFDFGYNLIFLRINRNATVSSRDLYTGYRRFFQIVTLAFMRIFIVLFWTLLLIVPGIIAMYKYCLIYYIYRDFPELSLIDVLLLSEDMMWGHKMRLFQLHLSFALWIGLSILSCGLLFLYTSPLIQSSTAAFYEDLKARIDD
jgi:uncharacterized membrane protein